MFSNFKTKKIIKRINKNIKFPIDTKNEDEYTEFLLPASEKFVNNKKIPNKYVKMICEALIKKAEEFVNNKLNTSNFEKVVVMISYPNLFNSRIIIFFNEFYYNEFFQRNNYEQIWKRKNKEISLSKKLHFSIPKPFKEIGYYEEIIEDNKILSSSNLWFYIECD